MAASPPLRVFSPGFYSCKNKGDAALLFAMMGTLKREFGSVDAVLTSFTPEYDRERTGLDFLPMPLDPNGIFGGGVRAALRRAGRPRLAAYAGLAHLGVFLVAIRAWLVLYRRSPAAARLLPPRVRAVVAAIERADVAVAVPGGYLLAPAITDLWWLYHAATFALVLMLGKPLVLYPCSLGPFPGFHRAVARRLLPGSAHVLVRERTSEAVALRLGVPPAKLSVLPDAAFAFEDDGRGATELAPVRERLATLPRPWIGVSVRHYHFPNEPDPAAAGRAYLTAVAKTVDYVTGELNGSVVFVPQVLGTSETTDVGVARLVCREIADPARVVVLDDDLSPWALTCLYAEFEIMIGTRMHATILAMIQGTPVVAIAYGHKTTGTMEELELGEYVVPIERVEGHLRERVAALWAARAEVRASLPRRVDDARRRVETGAVVVRDVLAAARSGRAAPRAGAATGGGRGDAP